MITIKIVKIIIHIQDKNFRNIPVAILHATGSKNHQNKKNMHKYGKYRQK